MKSVEALVFTGSSLMFQILWQFPETSAGLVIHDLLQLRKQRALIVHCLPDSGGHSGWSLLYDIIGAYLAHTQFGHSLPSPTAFLA